MRTQRYILATALLAFVAGCGQAGDLPMAPRPERPAPARPPVVPQPLPGYGPLDQPGAADGAALLAGMRRAMAEARGVEAELRFTSEGYYKSGKRISELRRSTLQIAFTWAKPKKMRGHVIQTTNPLMEGGSLVTIDGQNVTARARGLLGLFPFKMKADDGRLANLRNHRFDQNNPDAHLKRLTADGATWLVLGPVQKKGRALVQVQIDGVKRLDNEIDREVLTLDPQTFVVDGLDSYARGKKVVINEFLTFRWNPTIGPDTFKM